MKGPTSTQIGAIAENLVVNALVTRSGGRYAPFRPFADDEGIDVLAYDKMSGNAIPIQVKARTVALFKPGTHTRGNLVHFEVRSVVLDRDKRSMLIAVLLDEQVQHIRHAWLIPVKTLRRIARKGTAKWVIRPSIVRNSKDRYQKYRYDDMSDLVAALQRLSKKRKGT